jgi:hypothetical protein
VSRSIVVVTVALLARCAPIIATPTDGPSARPRVASVVAVGDAITVTFSRPMLQVGEGSGVEMVGNYQLDGQALPSATKIACRTPDCVVVPIELPGGTLVGGSPHILRIANVVAQSGPGIEPDPTAVNFTRP